MNRTRSWLIAGGLVLLAALPASAQDLRTMELFAQADVSSYGTGQQPKQGYFFVFDGLYWFISKPGVATLGLPTTRTLYEDFDPADEGTYSPPVDIGGTDYYFAKNAGRTQRSTHNTGPLRGDFSEGSRIELGRMGRHHGWFLSTFRLQSQSESIAASDVDMVLGPIGTRFLQGVIGQAPNPEYDPVTNPNVPPQVDVFGDLPLTFDSVLIHNRVNAWSVELMYVYRTHQHRQGGFFEWFFGGRYLRFNDAFAVEGQGGILADSTWETEAGNSLVGGQIGLRWFRKRGRLMLSTEGRFLAAVNVQNIRQRGELGSTLTYAVAPDNMPYWMRRTPFNHAAHSYEFSPVVELRVEARYQLTRAVSFRAGWTGIWMDGISRGSNAINYEVPSMGILSQYERQDVWINGVTIGVDVNR